MRPSQPLVRLLAPLAVTAVLVAGCGGSDDGTTTGGSGAQTTQPDSTPAPEPNGVEKLSAATIVTKAKQAAQEASAVRVKGDVTESGQNIKIDFHLLAEKGGTGKITVQGNTVEITRVGRRAYLRGSDEFWSNTIGPDAAKLLGGKYLKVPSSDKSMAELISFTDVRKLMTELFSDVNGSGVRKSGEKELDGQRAITVTKPGKDGGVLYVALDGKPYPLRIESLPGDTTKGKVEFLDYDRTFKLSVPPAAETIDVSKLKGGA